MRNEVEDRGGELESEAEAEASPAPATPLLILRVDEDAVCVDDLCLPAEGRS